MNDTELRQRQLARLKGEVIDPIAGSALEFTPDPALDAGYASHCESQKYWEREPKPRSEWEPEHREFLQRINIQPENEVEPVEPFVVGYRRTEYGYLVALPAAKWPSPREPTTLDISQ